MTGGVVRGRLKVFLGYAAGVGKTYQMLSEAQDLKKRGIDVVIAYFEPHARKETIALSVGLETLPRKVVEYRGAAFEEMDIDAVLRRHPAVAVVDEFPHTNVPGSARTKRWEDVHMLLDAGIDVLTTMNVQHVESLNDHIWQSTGVRVRETVPDWVLKQADDIVMVDVTPRALLNRLERGAVYPPEKVQAALKNFFTEPTLVALRELAMRTTAHAVESHEPTTNTTDADRVPALPVQPTERLVLMIEPHPSSAALIRRGRRVADYLHAECLAVYVSRTSQLGDLTDEERQTVEQQLNFARGLRIESRVLEGEDRAQTLVDFARLHGATQILVMRPKTRTLPLWRGRGLVQRIVGLAPDMQVTIVADRSSRHPSTSP